MICSQPGRCKGHAALATWTEVGGRRTEARARATVGVPLLSLRF